MLRPQITSLPGHIQSVFVQNILKLYGKILKAAEAKEDDDIKTEVHALLQEKLPVFVQSGDLEVQERVSNLSADPGINSEITKAKKNVFV